MTSSINNTDRGSTFGVLPNKELFKVDHVGFLTVEEAEKALAEQARKVENLQERGLVNSIAYKKRVTRVRR